MRENLLRREKPFPFASFFLSLSHQLYERKPVAFWSVYFPKIIAFDV